MGNSDLKLLAAAGALAIALAGCSGGSNDGGTSGGGTTGKSPASDGGASPVSGIDFAGLESITDVSGNSVRLNWSHEPGASAYFIYDTSGTNPRILRVLEAPASDVTIGSLSTSTTYSFRVRLVDGQSRFDDNGTDLTVTTLAQSNRILDDVSGGVAAFALRKLRWNYSGAAIRLRRSSDGQEADIGFDADGRLDTGAVSNHLSGDTGYVTVWYDQAGDNDASQTNVARQPQLQLSVTPAGRAAIVFDGDDDLLESASVNYTARTAFSAWRVETARQQTSDLAQVWGSYDEGVHAAPDPRSPGTISFDGSSGSGGTARWGLDGGAYGASESNPASTGWSNDTWHQLACEFNTDRALSAHTLGSLYPAFNVGEHQFGGSIAEIIVFNRALTDTERGEVEADQSAALF